MKRDQNSHLNFTAQQILFASLIAYLGVYFACAAILQLLVDIPPSRPGAPVEFFTAGILWMLSLTCLMTASKAYPAVLSFLLWLAFAAGLAGLAIDEVFEFHERTRTLAGDDDYIKVALWLISGSLLYALLKAAPRPHVVKWAIWAGYLMHSCYMIVELGDGEFFMIPFVSQSALSWLEEFLELIFLSVYLVGFVLLYTNYRRIPD